MERERQGSGGELRSIGGASEEGSEHRETLSESDLGRRGTRAEGNAGSRRSRRRRNGIYPDDPRPRHGARASSAAHQLRPPSLARSPISCFVFQAPHALCLMRIRPAVIPPATALLAPSALRRPQAPITLSALSSPSLSSALFGGGRNRPRHARPPSSLLPVVGAASPQQTSSVAAVTASQSA